MVLEDAVSDRIGTTFPRGFAEEKVSFDLVRAGDLVTLNYGKSLVAQERTTGAVPVYGTNGRCGWNGRALAEGPTVILGRKGMGPLGVEWCGGPFWVIDTAYYVTPNRPDLDLSYFYYLTKYIGLNHLKDGTSNPSLSRDTFYAQLLPLPTYDEQRRVASLFRSLDDKIDLNRRMNETLEAIARALFRSWFVDFDPVRAKHEGRQPPGLDAATVALFPDSFEDSPLGPIPAGWRTKTLGEFCEQITDGAHLSPASVEDGLPMASVKDMTNWGIDLTSCRRISPKDFEKLVANECQPRRGDVLLAKDGGYCLDTACEFQQEEKMVLLSSIAILRPKLAFASSFLHLWLELDSTKQYLKEGFRSGSAIPRVVLRDLKRAQLILPLPVLIEAFDRTVQPLRRQVRLNVESNSNLAALRDALLPKLLSGEIRVGDPVASVQ